MSTFFSILKNDNILTEIYMYKLFELVVANLLPLFPWYFHYASNMFRQNGDLCDCFNNKRLQHLHVMGAQPFTLKRFNSVYNTITFRTVLCRAA